MRYLLLIIILLPLNFGACSREKLPEESTIIARVNNEVLTENSLLEFSGLETLDGLTEAELRERIEELIKLTVLAQEAKKREVTESPEIKERIRIAEMKIKANALLAMLLNKIELSETEVFNHYQIHKSRYLTEREEYRIQRILLPNAAMADSVSAMINNADLTFAVAARRYSQERSRESDGFIGYMTPDEIEPAIWNAISNLAQFRYARVPVSNGIYLVRYTDKRNRTIERPFTEVIDSVRAEVMQEKRADLVDNLVRELMGRSEIIISR